MYPSKIMIKKISDSVEIGMHRDSLLIKEFLGYLNNKNRKLLMKLNKLLVCYKNMDQMELLRTKFLADPTIPESCSRKFYEILEKHRFRKENEILECISSICDAPEQDYSFWLRCPWIKDIKFDEETKMYILISTIGEFSFRPVKDFYSSDIDIIKQKAKIERHTDNIDYECHFVTQEFVRLHPDNYAVTCICPNCFSDSYWLHSYNVSANKSYVIDIANRFIMPIDDFDRLVKPEVLDETLGMDIPIRLKQIEENASWQLYDSIKHIPLKALAFYNYDCMSQEERLKRFRSIN